jgi:hypothetical protein
MNAVVRVVPDKTENPGGVHRCLSLGKCDVKDNTQKLGF